mgnify:CR=1
MDCIVSQELISQMRVKRMNRTLSHSVENEKIHASRAKVQQLRWLLTEIYNSGGQIDN